MKPLIAAGVELASQGLNAFATGKMNKATRKWAQMMYNKQRRHTLEDWAMQNEYNSPSAQMARLKEAGLNPNLVYESGVHQAADKVGQSDVGNYQPKAPEFDFGRITQSAIDAKQANLQAKQTEEQTENLRTQKELMAAQTLETNSKTANNTQDLTLKKEVQQYNVDAARLQNARVQMETNVLEQRNAREAVMQSQNIKESIARIAELNARVSKNPYEINQLKNAIESGTLDNEFKKIENELAKKNIFKNDPLYARLAVLAYNKLTEGNSKSKKIDPQVEHSNKYFKEQSRFIVHDIIRQLFEGK